jgi:hypothetical protein
MDATVAAAMTELLIVGFEASCDQRWRGQSTHGSGQRTQAGSVTVLDRRLGCDGCSGCNDCDGTLDSEDCGKLRSSLAGTVHARRWPAKLGRVCHRTGQQAGL